MDDINLRDNEFLSVKHWPATDALAVKLTTMEPAHLVKNHRGMVPLARMVHTCGYEMSMRDLYGMTRELQLLAITDTVRLLREKASREVAWIPPQADWRKGMH